MSDEEKKDSNEEAEEDTANQDGPAGEENKTKESEEDTSTNEDSGEEEKVTLSKEEHEKLTKKATDFDGIINKQRLAKLAGDKKTEGTPSEKTEDTPVDVIAQAEEAGRKAAQDELRKGSLEKYKENLGSAYTKLITDHKWLDSDEKVAEVAKHFTPGAALSEEAILSKLKRATQDAYPAQYDEIEKERIRNEVLAETSTIKVGGAGSGSGSSPSSNEAEDDQSYTKADMVIATKYFGGDIKRYLKQKKED